MTAPFRRSRVRVGWTPTWLAALAALTLAGDARSDTDVEAALADAITDINAQCPPAYPEAVRPVPDAVDYAALDNNELLTMLSSWNPALRAGASNALAERDSAVMPALVKAAQSDDPHVRAGAAMALERILRREVREWRVSFPDAASEAEGQAKVRQRHAALEPVFITLTTDDSRHVRNAAVSGLATLAPQTPAAARAMVAVFADPDQYLASTTAILFEKHFDHDVLHSDEVVEAVRVALQSPFPRGKGHAIRVLRQLDFDAQRKLVPELLKLLDEQPMRDTMFGASGQAESIEILTELEITDLLPRLTTLMDKPMRGPGLFEPAIKSAYDFGTETKAILPQLRAYDQGLTEQINNAGGRQRPSLEARQTKIRELISHVENL